MANSIIIVLLVILWGPVGFSQDTIHTNAIVQQRGRDSAYFAKSTFVFTDSFVIINDKPLKIILKLDPNRFVLSSGDTIRRGNGGRTLSIIHCGHSWYYFTTRQTRFNNYWDQYPTQTATK